MFAVLGAALGAVVASFVNVVAERSISGKTWWGRARSECPMCGRVLSSAELVPIFSFLLQRGRCRGCGDFFGFGYLVTELVGALMGGLLAARWGFSLMFFSSFIASFFLLLNAITDFLEGYIFDMFSFGMVVPAALFRIAEGTVLDGLWGALLGFGIFAVIIIVSRGGMGWGDASLMFGAGAFLGIELTIFAFYVGVMSAAMSALILLALGKIKWGRGSSIPLAPFLAFGGFFALLCGNDIIGFIYQKGGF